MSLWLAGASLALGVGQSITGHSAAKRQAEAQSDLSEQQIKEAKEALDALGPVKEAKEKLAFTEFQEKAKSLGAGKGEAERTVAKKLESTGLKTTTGTTEAKRKVWQQFEQQETGIYGQLGKSMGEIEEFMASESGRLTSQIKSAQLQKAASDKAAGAKFLGLF